MTPKVLASRLRSEQNAPGCAVCRDCQRADWKRHKVECAKLAELRLWGQPYVLPPNSQACPGEEIVAAQPTKEQVVTDACNCCGGKIALVRTECCDRSVRQGRGVRDDELQPGILLAKPPQVWRRREIFNQISGKSLVWSPH